MRKTPQFFGGMVIVLIFVLSCVSFLRWNSQTFDEANYLVSGYSYVTKRDFRLNPEHPPLSKELAALPLALRSSSRFEPSSPEWESADAWRLGAQFVRGSNLHPHTLLTIGRIPSVFVGVLLVLLISLWSLRLWGPWGALLSMAIAALDPALIAHSSLITNDITVTFFVTLSLYLFWEYHKTHAPWLIALLGIAIGCALASKFSGILLLLILPLCIGIQAIHDRVVDKKSLTAVLWALLISAAVIWVTYLFTSPLLFFDALAALLERAWTFGHPGFLLGEVSTSGWWYYFLVAFFIKTPLGTLLLIGLSLVTLRRGVPLTQRDAAVLLITPLAFSVAASIGGITIGLRYILPVYPFLFVLCGHLATVQFRTQWVTSMLSGALVFCTAVANLQSAPWHLSFFNQLVGGSENGHRYLSDSNLDWGQGLIALEDYMDEQEISGVYLSYFGTADPTSYGVSYRSLPTGPLSLHTSYADPIEDRFLVVVSKTSQHGVYLQNPNLYSWLSAYEPVADLASSLWVYDFTDDPSAQDKIRNLAQQVSDVEH